MTLKILTLITAFLLAIISIRGKTWDEKEKSIKKKVTLVGWVSTILFTLSLAFGVAFEIQSEEEVSEYQRRLSEALSEIKQKAGENATQAELIKELSKSKDFTISNSERIRINIPISTDKPAKIKLFEYDNPINIYVTSVDGSIIKTYTALPSESPKSYVFGWSDSTVVGAIRNDYEVRDIPLDRFGRRINRFGVDEDTITPPIVDYDNLDEHRTIKCSYLSIELRASSDVRGKYYTE